MVEFDRKQELTRLRKKAEDFKRRAERGTRMIGDDEELRDNLLPPLPCRNFGRFNNKRSKKCEIKFADFLKMCIEKGPHIFKTIIFHFSLKEQ
jgi:hypothetical protein